MHRVVLTFTITAFMDLNDIVRIRMSGQQITAKDHKTVSALVAWMGAMQAQDYRMAKWAIGSRLPGATQEDVASAIDRGEIIRTHILRPTWHFVSADDIYWMLALSAPRIKSRMKSRNRELGLTGSVFSKCNAIIENALAQRHLTREELLAEIKKGQIAIEANRGSHLLVQAELEGIICSGKTRDGKHTYALLGERVPGSNTFNEDESLAKLAERYFSSHGPATLQDFIWWSGLPVTQARHALEMVKEKFISETIDGQTYWLKGAYTLPGPGKDVYLLPAFDEYVIGYKDRRACITPENHERAISSNGIFWPVILTGGKVAGIWKRALKRDKVVVTTDFFQRPGQAEKDMVEKAARMLGNFLQREAMVATGAKQ